MMKPNAHSVKNVSRTATGFLFVFSCLRGQGRLLKPDATRRSTSLPQVGEIQFPRMPKAFFAVAVALAAVAAAQPARRAASLVVVGGTVITENGARQVLTPGAVAIRGADIIDVDRPEVIAARYAATETI